MSYRNKLRLYGALFSGGNYYFSCNFTVLRKTTAFCFPPFDYVPLRETHGIEEVQECRDLVIFLL